MQTCTYLPIILLFFFINIISFANEELVIEDTDQILQNLPFKNNRQNWENAFTCNQPLAFFIKTGVCNIACELGLCEQKCPAFSKIEETQFQAEDCTSDSVQIYSAHNKSWNVTQSDYENANLTLGLTLIKNMNLFYEPIEKIKVAHLFYPMTKKIIENGKLKQIQIARILLLAFPDKNFDYSIGLELEIDLDQSGMNQIICLAEDSGCNNNNDYILKRKGVINAIQ